MVLPCSQVGSGCPWIPPDSEEGKKAASKASWLSIIFIKAKLIFHGRGERFYGGVKIFKNFLIGG
jgi:hypothetical protein